LDAYFNALVLEALHWEGETNVVAVHDSWFVPRSTCTWTVLAVAQARTSSSALSPTAGANG
jgi:hypothetical protein